MARIKTMVAGKTVLTNSQSNQILSTMYLELLANMGLRYDFDGNLLDESSFNAIWQEIALDLESKEIIVDFSELTFDKSDSEILEILTNQAPSVLPDQPATERNKYLNVINNQIAKSFDSFVDSKDGKITKRLTGETFDSVDFICRYDGNEFTAQSLAKLPFGTPVRVAANLYYNKTTDSVVFGYSVEKRALRSNEVIPEKYKEADKNPLELLKLLAK